MLVGARVTDVLFAMSLKFSHSDVPKNPNVKKSESRFSKLLLGESIFAWNFVVKVWTAQVGNMS